MGTHSMLVIIRATSSTGPLLSVVYEEGSDVTVQRVAHGQIPGVHEQKACMILITPQHCILRPPPHQGQHFVVGSVTAGVLHQDHQVMILGTAYKVNTIASVKPVRPQTRVHDTAGPLSRRSAHRR